MTVITAILIILGILCFIFRKNIRRAWDKRKIKSIFDHGYSLARSHGEHKELASERRAYTETSYECHYNIHPFDIKFHHGFLGPDKITIRYKGNEVFSGVKEIGFGFLGIEKVVLSEVTFIEGDWVELFIAHNRSL